MVRKPFMKHNSCIIVTGATGFIGSHIVECALEKGYRVVVLYRKSSRFDRLEGMRDQLDLVEMTDYTDLINNDELKALAPFAWIETAWKGAAGGDRNASYQIEYNVPRLINGVSAAAAIGCSTWIGLGSQAEYGNQNRILDEKSPNHPTTLYGKAKLSACWAGLGMADALGLRGVWLRIFSTYGPRDNEHWFIPYLIDKFHKGESPELTACEQQWDFLYVKDAASAVLACVEQARAKGVYNLGSGQPRRLKDMVRLVSTLCEGSVEPRFGAKRYRRDQVMHLEADIRRLCSDTQWQPTFKLEDGLRETIRAYRGQEI